MHHDWLRNRVGGRVARAVLAALLMTASAGVCAAQTPAQLLVELGIKESPIAVRETPGWHPPAHIVVRRMKPDTQGWLHAIAPGARITVVSTAQEVLKHISDADVLLGFCDNELIDAGKQLRWVQSFSIGVENCVSAPRLRSGAVLLTNMQRVAGPGMAEYAIGALLALARGFPQAIANQREGRWDKSFWESGNARSLRGKTLLVVGLGGIGTEVARRANALGMRVIATRNSSRETPAFVSHVGLANDLPELARQADAVVNALPLTPATTGLFNAAFFALLKPTAYFINVGRGASVVTTDLDAALRKGLLAGAALDVTDPEPLPPDNPLWHAPNILITPHVSAASDEDNTARLAVVEENLRRYAQGGHMLSVVQPARGY